jgi:hypothetical protein
LRSELRAKFAGEPYSQALVRPIQERKTMEPLAWLGVLAVIIGIVGVIVLLKGRKKSR